MDRKTKLIDNFLDGTISPMEKEELKEWVREDDTHMDFFKKRIKEYDSETLLEFDQEMAYQKFVTSVGASKTKSRSPYRLYKYAAIFIGLLTLGFLTKDFFLDKNIATSAIVKDVVNENKGAIEITFTDGSKKLIDSENMDDVTDMSGNIIANKSKGALTFASGESSNANDLVYNEIYIPFGQKLKINLSDGTKVWLNAGSRLRFPQKFVDTEKNRMVFLEGEAFFEVTKNKNKPFIVNTDEVDIKVLGTKFNLASYKSDHSVTTTLVEGAVSVYKTDAPAEQLHLTPSFQATYDKEGNTLNKKKVDTNIYTAWMQNKLIINSLKFSEILQKLERIHNVTFVNKVKSLNGKIFKGEFENGDIETVLNTISLSTPFTYKINQNEITISE
ncbi:FecR domain-containing protein [Zobellia sp.]|nr:FecR domain-containing protein [Zobellia sp.]